MKAKQYPVTSRAQIRALIAQVLVKALAAHVASLWTIQDVVAFLKVNERTFYRRRADWKFPAPDINEGSFIRWHPDTVKNWKNPNVKDSQKIPA
ncbi:MAG TPA: hypothetical protein VN516_09410 [Candidatus Baltobacteraceae bacterium]|nr:hypothetical protein [Candidatus Baltobacteraceae bacterium]